MTARDEAEVGALVDRLLAAATSGDADAYAAQFHTNGAVMPPNALAAVGRDAIRNWAKISFGTWELQVNTFSVDDRRIGSAVGFARYHAEGNYVAKGGGQTVPFDQKYVDVYVKDATGSWSVSVHIVNSNTKARTIWD